jgi:hypothetical protein
VCGISSLLRMKSVSSSKITDSGTQSCPFSGLLTTLRFETASRLTGLYVHLTPPPGESCLAVPVALQSLKDLGRLTYRRFLELFRHMVGLRGRVISPSQGLYLHRITQHRMTRTNIHALSGIRTHDPSNQPAKTHASDRTATVTGTGAYAWKLNSYVIRVVWTQAGPASYLLRHPPSWQLPRILSHLSTYM